MSLLVHARHLGSFKRGQGRNLPSAKTDIATQETVPREFSYPDILEIGSRHHFLSAFTTFTLSVLLLRSITDGFMACFKEKFLRFLCNDFCKIRVLLRKT